MKYYEWQRHEFIQKQVVQYEYYAMVFPFGSKIGQIEFDLEEDDERYYVEVEFYNDRNENLKVNEISPDIERKIKSIIYKDDEVKKKIFGRIFG